jgi:hypothetical protein
MKEAFQMEILRQEIIEAQKIRAQFVQWKLTLVAVLAGVGLGFYPSIASHSTAVLILIPFVCVYVDVCVRHLNLRVLIIAEFLRSTRHGATEKYFAEYEDFCYTKRRAFKLEDLVFQWSSIFLSAFVATVPILFREENANLSSLFFYVAGGGGIIVAILVEWFYCSYVSFIKESPDALKDKLLVATTKQRVSF